MQYQKSKKMEQLAVKKTKEFFEPYMTSDEIENERAINAIKSTIQEPEEIEKIRLFLDMLKRTDNEANVQDNRRNRYVKENFLEKYAKERNIEDLRFVLNIEDINLSYF